MKILYTGIEKQMPVAEMLPHLEYLPRKAIEKIGNFHRWEDAQATLNGFRLLATGLEQMGFPGKKAVKAIRYDGMTKPSFSTGRPGFNISHSGNIVVCALCNNCQVGVDIEFITAIELADFRNCWCKEEEEWMYSEKDTLTAFYYLWTRKEAVIKAFGKGLSYDLQSINVLSDKVETNGNGTWHLKSFHLDEHYAAALATSQENLLNITPERLYF